MSLATHTFDPNTGQPDLLVEFLKSRVGHLVVIRHPFHYSADTRSSVEVFEKGAFVSKRYFEIPRVGELLLYAKDLILTLFIMFSTKTVFDVYIGVDPLNGVSGLILRRLRRVKKVVLYTIDLPVKRFNRPFLDTMYHKLDIFCATNSDTIWDLSPRMGDLRTSYHFSPPVKNTRIVPSVFPMGTEPAPERPNLNRLLFVGHLKESQGLQLAIDSMPEIIARIPEVKLLIIGTGPYESALRLRAQELQMGDSIVFMGQIESHDTIERLFREGGIGIAPYVPMAEGITAFADPMKPKVYLACGLPIIMTRVPWFARIIEEKKAGIIIDYDKSQFVAAVFALLTDKAKYDAFRDNALLVAEGYTPEKVFGDALKSLVGG